LSGVFPRRRDLNIWLLSLWLWCAAAAADSSPIDFSIKRQPLGNALLDYSYQSNTQVVMPGMLAEGRLANAVNGPYTREQALDQLLANSGLEYTFSGEGTVTIRRAARSEKKASRRERRFQDWGLEQMLVTAPEEGSETLRDITVSMSALDGEDLESRGVTKADELQQFVPGLTVESAQMGNTGFSIRGAGISNDDLSTRSGVGVFVDDVYIPRTGPANMALYELDRVDVLRGPQSVLYGRNATGGALVYVTRKPSPDFEARYLSDWGTRGTFNNILTLNGELADSVYGQAAFASFDRDPIMDNPGHDPPDGNDVESRAARLTLRATPSNEIEWLVSADGERSHQRAVLYSLGPSGPFQFNEQTPPVPASDPVRTAAVDSAGPERLDTAGVMSRLNVKTDTLWSSYIVAHRSHRLDGRYDLDQTPRPLVTKQFDENSDLVSLEARWRSAPLEGDRPVGHLDWQAGLQLLQENAEVVKTFEAEGVGAGTNRWRQALWEDSYSAYVQLGYAVTRRWRLTGGARYTADFRRFDLSGRSSQPSAENPYIEAPFAAEHANDWRRVTPRLGAHFQYTPDTAFYASLSSGYKPGGHAGTAANRDEADRRFAHERVTGVEAGVRSSWLENRLKFNTAAFSNRYEDMQVTGTDRAGKSFVVNAERAEIQGVELEIQTRPMPALNIRTGLSLVDARFKRFTRERDGGRVDKADDRVPGVPDATFNFSAVYLFPDLSQGTWSIRADAIYSEEAENINNEPAWPAYRVYNLWLDYLAHSGRWELALWVRNLRDEVYFQSTSPGITGGRSAFARRLAPPRTAGLSWKYFW
jgi:iron complex outermembrane receptor protein